MYHLIKFFLSFLYTFARRKEQVFSSLAFYLVILGDFLYKSANTILIFAQTKHLSANILR